MISMLGKIPLSEIQGPRDDFEQKLAGEDGPKWLSAFNRFLRKENPWPKVQTVKQYTFLGLAGTVKVSLPESFHPHDFFQTREGLWVQLFDKRALPAWETIHAGASASLSKFILARGAYTSEIISELPQQYLTELWQIAELIKCQPGGNRGHLLNNGCSNVFYVRDRNNLRFAFRVSWHTEDPKWDVYAWSLGENNMWNEGDQVFSPNC